jgi:hypothetical protein
MTCSSHYMMQTAISDNSKTKSPAVETTAAGDKT